VVVGSKKPQEAAASEQIYATAAECAAGHPADECDKAFKAAADEHEKTTTRYPAQATCEDVYGPGKCVPRHSDTGGDFFVPYMMGFMMGHLSSGPAYYRPIVINRTGYVYAGSTYVGTYQRRSPSAGGGGGGFVSPAPSNTVSRGGFGGGTSVPAPSAVTSPKASSPAPSAITSPTVSRGGFGSTASSSASSGGE
jgi:uncharacterized protein YgiB involved in biofilm formation